jgi:triphosphoribosyl-dephospho-CoA synthase
LNNDRLAHLVEDACRAEVEAPKPGNVHPGASFVDLDAADFLASARAIAPIFGRPADKGVGVLVLEGVRATRQVAPSNTNLGILLLFAPIVRAAVTLAPLRPQIGRVLQELTVEDARHVYEAIREASPGGLGSVEEQDVALVPTVSLGEAMRLAADRDSIARAYTNEMVDIWRMRDEVYRPSLQAGRTRNEAIVWTHLHWMAAFPDTLIARKQGEQEARISAERARAIVADWQDPSCLGVVARPGLMQAKSLADFDAWLRAEGHRRNPGTSADLVAATILLNSLEEERSAGGASPARERVAENLC